MSIPLKNRVTILVLGLTLSFSSIINAQVDSNAKTLFDQFSQSVYQVRVLEKQSRTKAAIGSGFFASSQGLLVSNYHVVAPYVQEPDKYALEVVNQENNRLPMDVIAVDVINDLALLKPTTILSKRLAIPLSHQLPVKGEEIYSLGNPHDLGFTVVEGTFNGYVAKAFYSRLLFTGPINPGMSGGPVLNRQGELVGVNVATAGNELGFLVPLEKIRALLNKAQLNHIDDFTSLQKQIIQQVYKNESLFMQALYQKKWPEKNLGKAQVIGEIAPFISCWGDAQNDDERLIKSVYTRCRSEGSMFLSPRLSTGSVEYEFHFVYTTRLNSHQFYQWYSNRIRHMSAGNRATKTDVSSFVCHEDIVNKEGAYKSVFCSRQYHNFPLLYDVLFVTASLDRYQEGVISHFALGGVTKKNGIRFAQDFMRYSRWKP
ncbi:MAG: serine protease [Pseudomonadota bacterium]